jgi:hypothetical protein
MTDRMYLLDNNALSHMTGGQSESTFFEDHCRVPSEVLHEAEGHPYWESFKALEYPMTVGVLIAVREVMAASAVDDTSLINLYTNKGSADPLIIACALDAIRESARYLYGPTWTIVSNDKAVCAKATELGIDTWTREEFFDRTRASWSTETTES